MYEKIYQLIELLPHYDVVFFDIWGVVLEDKSPHPEVLDLINATVLTKHVIFVTNSPRTREFATKRLIKLGFNISPDIMVTSGDIARSWIEISNFSIYHLGADRNNNLLQGIKCNLTRNIKEADILLMSLFRDEHENINEFDELMQDAIALGIPALCANPDDITIFNGVIRYGSGYFAQKYEEMGGVVTYTGKPSTEIFEKSFEKVPINDKSRILMVGDTPRTDILGSNRFGIDSALVMRGNMLRLLIDRQSQYPALSERELVTMICQQYHCMPKYVVTLY